jgi:hypothetical protein
MMLIAEPCFWAVTSLNEEDGRKWLSAVEQQPWLA